MQLLWLWVSYTVVVVVRSEDVRRLRLRRGREKIPITNSDPHFARAIKMESNEAGADSNSNCKARGLLFVHRMQRLFVWTLSAVVQWPGCGRKEVAIQCANLPS